jgi:beta-aspartyl-peptidase (threonine type)
MSIYAIVLHGGAVTMKPGELSPEEAAFQRVGLGQALDAGWQILHEGGSALDAVEAAVRSLEENEHFNAGRGSSLSRQGEAEMDAAIMDGHTLRAGIITGVKYVKHPISLARALLERGSHVGLSGEGALEFALECGQPLAPPSYFETEKTRRQWLELAQQETETERRAGHDTVGAVALDLSGNLAVATSTGGIEGQRKGRVGDSPVLGGGTYATNEACAVSCTGDGEVIMRGALAHEIYALVKYQRLPLAEACRAALALRDHDLQGDKGCIALDPQGHVAIEFNTNVMRRAYRVGEAEPYIAIFKDE